MNAANFKISIGQKLGKDLLIAAVIGVIIIIFLISTGIVTLNELIQMHFKLIEICPFCM